MKDPKMPKPSEPNTPSKEEQSAVTKPRVTRANPNPVTNKGTKS